MLYALDLRLNTAWRLCGEAAKGVSRVFEVIKKKSDKVKIIQINKKIEIIGNEVFKNFVNVETLYIPSTV